VKVDAGTAVAGATAALSAEGILLAVSALVNVFLGVPYLRSLVSRVSYYTIHSNIAASAAKTN
jgi:hypothetical protein